MQNSEIDATKKIDSSSPGSYKLFIYILAVAVVVALILVFTLDPAFLR